MPSSLKFPGLVDRIAERMRAQGYEVHGRLLWGRWAAEHGFQIALVGGWMKGGTPTYGNLERLARELGCSLAWLLLGPRPDGPWDGRERRRPASEAAGERMAEPIGGGSGSAEPQGLAPRDIALLLIRRWLKKLELLVPRLPQFVPA